MLRARRLPSPESAAAVSAVERRLYRGLVAFGPQLLEAVDLGRVDRRVVDLEDLELLLVVEGEAVEPDDGLAARVDPRLGAGGGLLDAHLGQPRRDRLGHPAELLDLGDVAPGALGELVGEPLDVVRAAPRVGDPADPGLLLELDLGVAGDPGREIGGQGERLVEGVGVQRLGVAHGRGQRLETGPGDVVVGILGGEAPARGLRVGAQHHGFGVCRPHGLHDLRPQQPRRAQLGDLHEDIHADGPEERDPRREGVDIETRRPAGADILDAVGEGVAELEIEARPGLLHVIAGDRDRVEARHLLRGIAEDVGDDPHRWFGGVDIGVADHELFEDVVLDGSRELLRGDALFFRGDDIERHHRQHRAVHGHGDADLVEGDPVEEDPHVLDRVDGDPGHADIAPDPRVVGVVAAVGGEIEGDGEALLTGRQIAPVEGVGILGGGEAGVLPDGPRPGGVHGGVGATVKRRQTRQVVDVLEAIEIRCVVERFDRDALRGLPHQLFDSVAGEGLDRIDPGAAGGVFAPVDEIDLGEVGDLRPRLRHGAPPPPGADRPASGAGRTPGG